MTQDFQIPFLQTAGGDFVLFYFKTKQAGIHSLSEDGNSINNYSDISAVSTAFSSTCCSSRQTSGQKLMASQGENHETSS